MKNKNFQRVSVKSNRAVSFFFLSTLIVVSSFVNGQSFRNLINRMNDLPAEERQLVVDSFMKVPRSFPIIETDSTIHFIYQGIAKHISIAGDFTEWKPDLKMNEIPGTNFWYLDATFEADARLDYKFVINDTTWILDPKNPNTCLSGFGPNSEFQMPGYHPAPELKYYNDIPHGTFHDTVISGKNFPEGRKIRVYLPPGYPLSKKEYPVIVFHDGMDYINLGQINNILDYLIFHHQIAPVIGIFVPPVDRSGEYAGKKLKAYSRFIIEELMPAMEKKYFISRDPHKRATIGASLGGNIALYLGMTHSEVFGLIAAQSSSVGHYLSSGFKKGKKKDLNIYMDIGKYDLKQLIPMVKNFIPVLQKQKYQYRFYEFHEGHSWGNWKAHLNLALKQFFPANNE
ncbi:MAG: alpha/beta hydrolase-fold protein [Bacteroidetes bacterium]|nr:alpha/beta hydrolase-fold protein [Bacteroidota bacterium]